jgi:hypothetical protein
MSSNVVYHIDQAHTYEASWYSLDCAYLFNSYKLSNSSFVELYSPRDLDKDSFQKLANLFCVLHAQNMHEPSQQMLHSLKPLYILRFMIHEDLSISNYDTNKRQPGNVVEALCWTNGMIYRVREDKLTDFKILQYGIFLAPITATILGVKRDNNI